MKKTLFSILLITFISLGSYGQLTRNVGTSVTNRAGNELIPITHLRLKTIDKSLSEEDINLQKKKYLFYSYNEAAVDDYDTKAFVRYNIFDDQMEFVKDESIYYLAKDIGRKIHFINTNTTYKVFEFKVDLHFFKVYVEGKNSLIAKQKVRYIEEKVAKSGYDRARPENYKRLKDEIYLAINNKRMVKLSKKSKKEFFKSFGDKSSEIQKYVKKNKLGRKIVEDLKKIVAYYNTL